MQRFVFKIFLILFFEMNSTETTNPFLVLVQTTMLATTTTTIRKVLTMLTPTIGTFFLLKLSKLVHL